MKCITSNCSNKAALKSGLCRTHQRELKGKPCSVNHCKEPHLSKGFCSKHYGADKQAKGLRKKFDFDCVVCSQPGQSYNRDTTRHAYCQRITTQAKDKKLSPSKELVKVKREAPPTSVTVLRGAWWQAGPCVTCGKDFVSSNRSWYCSVACSHKKRWRKFSKQARELIMIRDRGICQLCNKPVLDEPWDNKTFQPLYPSLDHIKPRAKGGSNDFSNLQLAHVICNSMKRDLFV